MTDDAFPDGKTFGLFTIDGNEAVFSELVKLLGTEKAIAFVGAGASAPLYPLWDGLVRELAELAVTTRKADARKQGYWCRKARERPDRIAKQIRDILDPGEFSQLRNPNR